MDKKIKSIVGSILVMAVVASLMTVGTHSYFSDTETSRRNIFTAGTIDISVNPASGQQVTTLEGDLELKPCQTGYTCTKVHNDGSNPCEVWKHIANVENRENGIVEPEREYYNAHPGSDTWKLSNWIHYDMMVYRTLGYSWSGTVTALDKEGNEHPITIDVTDGDCHVKWSIDFPTDDDPGDGCMNVALIIARDGDGNGPEYQIHNNDGATGDFPHGMWLYSPWGPTIEDGWFGWHSSDDNTPVSDLDWVECTGERKHSSNPTGEFTVAISKCKLVDDFHWALYISIGSGFYNFGTQYLSTPEAFTWTEPLVDMAKPNYAHAEIAELIQEITEDEGFMLTGNNGVECKYIYLGTISPCETLIVIQSYHLDASVENWGQSDRVIFDIEFVAQQIEGDQLPPPPGTVLPGYGRPD